MFVNNNNHYKLNNKMKFETLSKVKRKSMLRGIRNLQIQPYSTIKEAQNNFLFKEIHLPDIWMKAFLIVILRRNHKSNQCSPTS